jgi:hypothetical protein
VSKFTPKKFYEIGPRCKGSPDKLAVETKKKKFDNIDNRPFLMNFNDESDDTDVTFEMDDVDDKVRKKIARSLQLKINLLFYQSVNKPIMLDTDFLGMLRSTNLAFLL